MGKAYKCSSDVVRFPSQANDDTTFLYCNHCGTLVGILDKSEKKAFIDGKFCKECGKKIKKDELILR